MDCPPAPYYFDHYETGYDDGTFEDVQAQFTAFTSSNTSRKRKPDRACDSCRRRKTKCNGPQTGNHVCTNCQQSNSKCTYVETSKPRGPPKAYVTALEDRMEKMEALLTRLRPETNLDAELGPGVVRGSWRDDVDEKTPPPPASKVAAPASAKASGKMSIAPRMRAADDDAVLSDGSDDSDDVAGTLTSGVRGLTLQTVEPPVLTTGFIGKSSTMKLVTATRKLKEAYVDEATRTPSSAGPDDGDAMSTCSSAYREEYWATPEWELSWMDDETDSEALLADICEALPPDDLAASLTELFFVRVNPHWPLLHRPTFERQRAAGLHERDVWFAALCAGVFAVASRWSDDPRVLAESGESHYTAGWEWFQLVVELHQARRAFVQPAGLFEVQTLCLLPMFLSGTEYEAAAWLYLSMGLRKAQDVGAHRRKAYSTTASVEDELWRRAFWVLVVQDRMMSAHLGRDCNSREEEFDVQMPLEVDDDYWTAPNSAQAFVQPESKPSTVAAFTARIKLSSVVAFALRTVCASENSKVVLGYAGADWKVKAVTELNTALTEWAKNLPEHLRWSSDMDSSVFAHQSASLFATYYTLQILIYRPFVAPPCTWDGPCTNPSRHPHPQEGFPFPAGAICRAAARAFVNIGGDLVARGLEDGPTLIGAAQLSAAVLVAYAWEVKVRARAAGAPVGAERVKVEGVLGEVRTVMQVLEAAKERWPNAAAVLDDLNSSMPGPDDQVHVANRLPPTQQLQQPKLEPMWPDFGMPSAMDAQPALSANWLQQQVTPATQWAQPPYDPYAGMLVPNPAQWTAPASSSRQPAPRRRRAAQPTAGVHPQQPSLPMAQLRKQGRPRLDAHLQAIQGALPAPQPQPPRSEPVAKRQRRTAPAQTQTYDVDVGPMSGYGSAPIVPPDLGALDFGLGASTMGDLSWGGLGPDAFAPMSMSGMEQEQMSGAGAGLDLSGLGQPDFWMDGQFGL